MTSAPSLGSPSNPGASASPPARTTLRFLAAPTEAGTDGRTVEAGRVLEWIDRAAYACAAGWSGAYCVTAYVGNVHFGRAIAIGSLLEVDARIIATGRTSMQILVTVSAADPAVGREERVAHCLLVLVAVDEARLPRAVPQWVPTSAHDLALRDNAEHRTAVRARIRQAMEAAQYTDAGTTPRLLLRFLAAPGDVNWGGRVHGGTVMRWIDEAVQACATSFTGRPTLSVYAGGIHFHRPIEIGQLVEVESRVIHAGPHSAHVATHVRSAPPVSQDYRTTARCISVVISRGDDGRALPVPRLELASEEDRRLVRHAKELEALRAELDAIE